MSAKTSRGANNQQVGRAGEDFVVAELNKRGAFAVPFTQIPEQEFRVQQRMISMWWAMVMILAVVLAGCGGDEPRAPVEDPRAYAIST